MTRTPFAIFRCGVVGIQAVEAETNHTFQRHTHEQYGIGVISRGAQKSHSGRGMVEAGAGDVITVNPGEVHDGAPLGDGARAWRMLYFDPALVARAIGDISHDGTIRSEFSSPVIRDARVAQRFRRLFLTLTTVSDREAANEWEELFLMLLEPLTHEQDPFDRKQKAFAPISAARICIDDDPAAPITLSDLARETGLSRFQVLRGFAKSTGLTPHAYLVQRRINLARRLIAQGTSLAEAAISSGFADQSHMTRIFVRKYGISPGAYADALI